jgi:hypothetical protein
MTNSKEHFRGCLGDIVSDWKQWQKSWNCGCGVVVITGMYDVFVRTKLCKRDKGCGTCDSICELRENQNVDSLLHASPVKRSKSRHILC